MSFIMAIRTGAEPPVPATAARDALALVQSCYAQRQFIDMPWLSPIERGRARMLREGVA